jgi:hypothetical protein
MEANFGPPAFAENGPTFQREKMREKIAIYKY